MSCCCLPCLSARAIDADRLSRLLSFIVSLAKSLLANPFYILPSHTFVNFAAFLEAMIPQPVEYSPQDSILGKVNADRFVRLMETHRKGVYDLSTVCSFLASYNVTHKEKWLMPFLKTINGDSLQLYLSTRISEVSLYDQITGSEHDFDNIFKLHPVFKLLTVLLTFEQVTYQFNYLLHTSSSVLKESIMTKYAKLTDADLAKYVGMWLNTWKHSLHNGLTEVMGFQLDLKHVSSIHHKLSVTKLYFRNNEKRMAAVKKLEEILQEVL